MKSGPRWRSINAFANQLLILIFLLGLTPWVRAAETGHHQIEHHIKAVFLYKFAAYIDWPPSAFSEPETPFTIGVVGADEIAIELTLLSQASNGIKGRPIQIQPLGPEDTFDHVHILFIGENHRNNLSPLLSNVRAKPVLTVTESPDALTLGSIINFVPVGDYIRFEISAASADANNIKISARLLDVAQKIDHGRP